MIWNPTKDYAGAMTEHSHQTAPTHTLMGLKKVVRRSNNKEDDHAWSER
jgi:hypothetical protein